VSIPNAVALDTVLSDPAVIDFFAPRDDARPWVYWYFMDGNLTREGMEADLVAMKQAGIVGAIFLEVGIGTKPGPVEFMSEPWQELPFGHPVRPKLRTASWKLTSRRSTRKSSLTRTAIGECQRDLSSARLGRKPISLL
jgi:hypothetical protein